MTITLCNGTFVFSDMKVPESLAVASIDNARFLPAHAKRDRRGRLPNIPADGLLGNCLGGVLDAEGNPVPEARYVRSDRHVVRVEGPPGPKPDRFYAGNYVYGGVVIGYYGHFLLETLARLWFIAKHPRDFDGIVFHVLPGVPARALGWLRNAFSLLGIDEEKILLPEDCMFERLTVPEPAFESPATIHPAMVEPFEQMAREHLGTETPARNGTVYISRTGLDRRETLGEIELERILADQGIDIVRMENATFEEKIEIFNRYERIIGLSGSGLHNVVFCLGKPELYVINRFYGIHVTYPAIDRVKELTAHYACVGKCNPRYEFVPPYLIDVQQAVAFLVQHGLVPPWTLEAAEKVDQGALHSAWRNQAFKRRGHRLKAGLKRLRTQITGRVSVPSRLPR